MSNANNCITTEMKSASIEIFYGMGMTRIKMVLGRLGICMYNKIQCKQKEKEEHLESSDISNEK